MTGDPKRAAVWLEGVPATPPYGLLRWWATAGPACLAGTADPDDLAVLLQDGWAAYHRQRVAGSRLGIEQSLPRIAAVASRAGLMGVSDQILADATATVRPLDQLPSLETRLLVQGLVCGDVDAATTSVALARARGHRPATVYACLTFAVATRDPQPWLREAYDEARHIAGGHLRARITGLMREHGMRPSRPAARCDTLTEWETHIVALVRGGRTNRQIAMRVNLSEKTIETQLTRLFAKTGCRSRVELASTRLAGTDVCGVAS